MTDGRVRVRPVSTGSLQGAYEPSRQVPYKERADDAHRIRLGARRGDDARHLRVPRAGRLLAGGRRSVGGLVQAGGRSELLLRGQGVRLAVGHSEVPVRPESRAGAGGQRRAGGRKRVSATHGAELSEDDGQLGIDFGNIWGVWVGLSLRMTFCKSVKVG